MGNLEACFLAGLRCVFMEAHRSLTPPIEWLEHSTEAGHKLGMYVFTLVLYRSNTSGGNDDIARSLLRELKGVDEPGLAALPWKNQTCTRCRKDMYWQLQDMVPQHVEPIFCPILPRNGHCTSSGYGEPDGFEEWDLWARFYKEECRISWECYKLFT